MTPYVSPNQLRNMQRSAQKYGGAGHPMLYENRFAEQKMQRETPSKPLVTVRSALEGTNVPVMQPGPATISQAGQKLAPTSQAQDDAGTFPGQQVPQTPFPFANQQQPQSNPNPQPPQARYQNAPPPPNQQTPDEKRAEKKGSNPNSTQNMLQIAEIRDGVVIMNDGSFRSVIMVKSINFDLMSSQEQEGIEYSYQSFLNSLFFPIQIFIRSQKVDIAPYIARLNKIRNEHDNMLLALLMDDYVAYISQLSQQTNIMDKKFYIVVPYFQHESVNKAIGKSKNFITGLGSLLGRQDHRVIIDEQALEKAKSELRNRVQSVLSALMQCTLPALPLDTQELIELYYDTYNPDTATHQQLKNFGDLNADVITKGKGFAKQPHLDRELI